MPMVQQPAQISLGAISPDDVTYCRSSGGQQPGSGQPAPMVLRCGGAVLQDLAVAVADAAADAYLAEAGVSRQGRQLHAMQPAFLPASCTRRMLKVSRTLRCQGGVTLSLRTSRNAGRRMWSARARLHLDEQGPSFQGVVPLQEGARAPECHTKQLPAGCLSCTRASPQLAPLSASGIRWQCSAGWTPTLAPSQPCTRTGTSCGASITKAASCSGHCLPGALR